jgi:hypothetical protein
MVARTLSPIRHTDEVEAVLAFLEQRGLSPKDAAEVLIIAVASLAGTQENADLLRRLLQDTASQGRTFDRPH